MRNTVMTGPIILSKEDSSRLRQNILHPTVEYLQEQERYFEEIASSMIIHKEGSNTRVEFKDLDLSNLDLMIEKEKNAAPVQVLMLSLIHISVLYCFKSCTAHNPAPVLCHVSHAGGQPEQKCQTSA